MTSAWQILTPPKGSPPTPTLLVKPSFTKSSYTIYLTDLTNIWSETADRRDIIRRALNEDTTIDPSEDADQLRVLLERVQSALQGREATSLALEHVGARNLRLRVASSLPAPLKPLQWSIYLSLAPSSVLTDELIVPLLVDYMAQASQIRSLLDTVKSKDHVMEKLVDKLEPSGIDLGMIFPGLAGLKSGKRSTSRDIAGRFVKGLGVFDEESWRRESEGVAESVQELGQLVAVIFSRDVNTPKPASCTLARRHEESSWWERLEPSAEPLAIDHSQDEPFDQPRSGQARPTEKQPRDEDGFQRQTTPEHLHQSAHDQPKCSSKGSRTSHSNTTPDDEETTDEDDAGATAHTSAKVMTGEPHGRDIPTPSKAARTLGQIGGAKASAADSVPSPTKGQHGRLGTIGGAVSRQGEPPREMVNRRKQADEPAVQEKQDQAEDEQERTSVKTESRGEDDDPVETAQQRADRKREELKRQMEEKSRAPAKKKRRF